MNLRANAEDLRSALDRMFLEYPELKDDETLRADMLEGETELYAVIGKIVEMATEAETISDAIAIRISALSERKARYARKYVALRNLILDLMQAADLQKIVIPEATLSLRQIAPAPIVIDENSLPENCIRIKREPDMKAIKEQIEQGITVAGTAMGNGKTSLGIRIK